jgi:two-component system, OmpR family, sensor histidine kinase KdpD
LAMPSATLGSIVAIRPSGAPEFSQDEVNLLRNLAGQTALAIERASLNEEVRAARLEAETSSMRAALFSSVTHDLRTPLSSIKAGASGLLSDDVQYTKGQRTEMLTTILEEVDHLNQIVSNLLDLARIRAGVLRPENQPIFIEDVIGSTVRRMDRSLQSFALRTSIRSTLPPVLADPIQISQVLYNLLENSIRFSPPGSELLISAARWHSMVEVRVTDHGPGIDEEVRERVFEEFYSRPAGRGRGGTGLGLAIARAIVLAHGGKIWAEVAPGGGTSIVFQLPIASATETAVDDASPQKALSD